ncbi:MAG: quinohemoprotein ethanol dehydrogenase [Saprospiraceae bacterium]|jgi:quinohemoprotein ethanol dehydrogenase
MAVYKGSIYWGTIDGRLLSVDASTGTLNWEVMTVPIGENYTITGATRIAKGNIIIVNGGAEYDARGFVTAYDAGTGEKQWRFYSVPGNPANEDENAIHSKARDTWTGEYWKMGGGGTVWDAIVYDPELDQLYLGVGNGSPWDLDIRSPQGGDNWFLSSIVALDPDDGTYKWHYQTTPGDTWDYTSTQPMILADLTIEGQDRKVIMQAPKNGFFYVIDRTDGSFISAKPYTYANWATEIDNNGRPIEAEGARYNDGQNRVIAPGAYGGHNWHPMAFNHETGLVYIPAHMSSLAYSQNEKFSHNAVDGGGASGTGWNVSYAHQLYRPLVMDDEAPNPYVPPIGRLVAYDSVNQKEVWSRKMTSH